MPRWWSGGTRSTASYDNVSRAHARWRSPRKRSPGGLFGPSRAHGYSGHFRPPPRPATLPRFPPQAFSAAGSYARRMTTYRPENPLIVQGDLSVLAEVASPRFGEARDRLARFAELVKSPEHVHTYRVTPLSVWNACAAGADPEEIVGALREYAKYAVPANVERTIRDAASRFGRLLIERDDDGLVLACDEAAVMEEVSRIQKVAAHLGPRLGATA